MAAITPTSMQGTGARVVTITTLGASDTLTYSAGKMTTLILRNGTAGALTPLIDGAGGANVSVPGLGLVSVAAGYSVPSIAAGATASIPLDSIREYLKGVVTVTGADGISATLLEF